MSTRKSDAIRIRHMLDSARKAVLFSERKERPDLDSDEQLSLALVRLVEIIGEAASKVTEETKQQLAPIPWKNIIGTRNRLIHAYEQVDNDILWQIVQTDLPALIPQLEKAIEKLDEQRSLF